MKSNKSGSPRQPSDGVAGRSIDHRRCVRQRRQRQRRHIRGDATGRDNTRPRRDPAATEPAATEPAGTDAPATQRRSRDCRRPRRERRWQGRVRHRRRRPRRRRRVLPSGRRRGQDALHRERLRGSDRGRQHPGGRRRHRDGRPRPTGCRRDHRRRIGDRRAAPRSHRQVPRRVLVLQLRRRLPTEPGPVAEHRRRQRDQLHRRLRDGSEAEGEGWRFGGHHRLLRPRLREAGVHGVRARPEGRRSGVHTDLCADR